MMTSIKVLDHGFVRLVETWGGGDHEEDNEAGIIEAARQSTQGSFRGWEEDERLLRFLYRNKHSTPFEFAGAVIEVKAPLFVFREWHRHRTQSYNEMSARYAPLPDESYIPSIDRIMRNARDGNKQAGAVRGAEELTSLQAHEFQHGLIKQYEAFEVSYRSALEAGVPKELARCGMPVGRYSQMRASTCLRNWLGFLTLRMSPQAQWETQQYASAVRTLLLEEFPKTMGLFAEGFES